MNRSRRKKDSLEDDGRDVFFSAYVVIADGNRIDDAVKRGRVWGGGRKWGCWGLGWPALRSDRVELCSFAWRRLANADEALIDPPQNADAELLLLLVFHAGNRPKAAVKSLVDEWRCWSRCFCCWWSDACSGKRASTIDVIGPASLAGDNAEWEIEAESIESKIWRMRSLNTRSSYAVDCWFCAWDSVDIILEVARKRRMSWIETTAGSLLARRSYLWSFSFLVRPDDKEQHTESTIDVWRVRLLLSIRFHSLGIY